MTFYQQGETTANRRKFKFVCVENDDGKTPKHSLSFSGSEVKWRVSGGTYAALTNIASIVEVDAASEDGEYEGEFTEAELTGVDGPIYIKVKKTDVRTTVMCVGQVVPWDPYAANLPAQVKGMDAGVVTATAIASNAITDAKINDGAITAAKIATYALTHEKFAEDVMIALGHIVMYGAASTAQAATSTTITLPSIASATDDFYNGFYLLIGGGTGFGQLRRITDYVGATKIAAVDSAWAATPSTDSVCIIFASPPSTADIDAALTASHGAGSWGAGGSLYGVAHSGTAQGAGAGNRRIQLDSGASASNDAYNDYWIFLTAGTGAGQIRRIADYNGSTKNADVSRDFSPVPDNTTEFEIYPRGDHWPSEFLEELMAHVMEANAHAKARTFAQRERIMFSALVGDAPEDLEASPYYFRDRPGATSTKDRAAFTMVNGVRTATDLDGDE